MESQACPSCGEDFQPSQAFEHLLSFHVGRRGAEEWGCGECVFGDFNETVQHCFRLQVNLIT